MTKLNSCLTILAALAAGIAIGSWSHPQKVQAQAGIGMPVAGGVRLNKVTDGFNSVIGSSYLGFACTNDDCFVLTK